MRRSVPNHAAAGMLILAIAIMLVGCDRRPDEAAAPQKQVEAKLKPGEFGRAIDAGPPAQNLETFDTLDFDVFSNQKWNRLGESHAEDIVVSWPDGHDTRGADRHIEDLKQLFVHAPDTAIKTHPIRIAKGEWTAVTGVMTGTFTRPMKMADGSTIQPTGKKFSLPMATIAHWKDGKMDHEWLYWDNAAYVTQLGLDK